MSEVPLTPVARRMRAYRRRISAPKQRAVKCARRIYQQNYRNRKKAQLRSQQWRDNLTTEQRAERNRKQREYARKRRAARHTSREDETASTTCSTATHRRSHRNATCRPDSARAKRVRACFPASSHRVQHTHANSKQAAHRSAVNTARTRISRHAAPKPRDISLDAHTRECLQRVARLNAANNALRREARTIESQLHAKTSQSRTRTPSLPVIHDVRCPAPPRKHKH